MDKEEKKNNRLQWFLFVVLIPLLFTITIALIVLSFAGVNVLHASKSLADNIPFISKMTGSSDKNNKAAKEGSTDSKKELAQLEAGIKSKTAEVAKLENIIDSKDQEIQRSSAEKQQLENEIKDLNAAQADNKRAMKDIVTTYETMAPKKAAPILTKMPDDNAVRILSKIKAASLAAIMEQMQPADAARLTKKLTDFNQQQTP
ncbi:MotE family protein [Actinomycetes bacterium NPDC127524]